MGTSRLLRSRAGASSLATNESMIPKLFMARTAGIFDFLHGRPEVAGLVRLNLAGNHQVTGGGFKGAGHFLKTCLLLPHGVLGTGVIFFTHLREMFPRLMGQRIKLHCAVSKFAAVKRNTATQHAAQVLAGLEHLLEDRLALTQGRIGINAAAGGQGQAGQQYNRKSFKSHGGFRSRETAASILVSSAKTNSPINNMGCLSAWSTRATVQGITP